MGNQKRQTRKNKQLGGRGKMKKFLKTLRKKLTRKNRSNKSPILRPFTGSIINIAKPGDLDLVHNYMNATKKIHERRGASKRATKAARTMRSRKVKSAPSDVRSSPPPRIYKPLRAK